MRETGIRMIRTAVMYFGWSRHGINEIYFSGYRRRLEQHALLRTDRKGTESGKHQTVKRNRGCNGAKIVLSSTWKQIWDDTGKDAKDMRFRLAHALDAYRLFIYAFTPNLPMGFRPEEIKQFLEQYKSVHPMEKVVWISLDDDYKEEHYRSCGLGFGLIQTRFFCKSEDEGGLQDIHVEKAIQMLGRKHDHCY